MKSMFPRGGVWGICVLLASLCLPHAAQGQSIDVYFPIIDGPSPGGSLIEYIGIADDTDQRIALWFFSTAALPENDPNAVLRLSFLRADGTPTGSPFNIGPDTGNALTGLFRVVFGDGDATIEADEIWSFDISGSLPSIPADAALMQVTWSPAGVNVSLNQDPDGLLTGGPQDDRDDGFDERFELVRTRTVLTQAIISGSGAGSSITALLSPPSVGRNGFQNNVAFVPLQGISGNNNGVSNTAFASDWTFVNASNIATSVFNSNVAPAGTIDINLSAGYSVFAGSALRFTFDAAASSLDTPGARFSTSATTGVRDSAGNRVVGQGFTGVGSNRGFVLSGFLPNLAMVSARFTSTTRLEVLFNNPIDKSALPGSTLFDLNLSGGSTSDLGAELLGILFDETIAAGPNSIVLQVPFTFGFNSEIGVGADGRAFDINGSTGFYSDAAGRLFSLNVNSAAGFPPLTDIFGGTFSGSTTVIVSDAIPPTLIGAAFMDRNSDGDQDGVALIYNEPLGTAPATAALTLNAASGQVVRPVRQITPTGTLVDDSTLPPNALLPISATPSIAFIGLPLVFLGPNNTPSNAVVIPFNPVTFDWDGGGITLASEAIPGTGDSSAVLVRYDPAAVVAASRLLDAAGNEASGFNFIPASLDYAPPRVLSARFLTADNQQFGVGNPQLLAEQDSFPGDSVFNNEARLVFSEGIGSDSPNASQIRFGPGGGLGWFQSAFRVTSNTLSAYLPTTSGFAPGVQLLVQAEAFIPDQAGNRAVTVTPVTVSDGVAPYARAFYIVEPALVAVARLNDAPVDGFADSITLNMSRPVDPTTVQASDFQLNVGTITSATVSGSTITLALQGGQVGINTPVQVTYRGASDPTRIASTSGNAVDALDSVFFAIGSGLGCPLPTTRDSAERGSTADCNANGVIDACDIAAGTSTDFNWDTIPDECQVAGDLRLECQTDPFTSYGAWASFDELFDFVFAYQGCDVKVVAPGALFTGVDLNYSGIERVEITSRQGITVSSGRVFTLANKGVLETAPSGAMTVDGELRIPANINAELRIPTTTINAGGTATFSQNSSTTVNGGWAGAGVTRLFPGATLNLSGAVASSAGSVFTAQSGALLSCSSSVAFAGSSTFSGASLVADSLALSGGTHSLLDSFIAVPSINVSSTAVLNRCSISGATTVQSTGRLTLAGDHYGGLTNSGRVFTVGTTLLVGNLTNNVGAAFTVQIGVTTLIGSLVNNGSIVGQIQNPGLVADADFTTAGTAPGDGLFVQGNLTLGSAAALSLPESVWRLSVSGNYDNAINSNTQFNLRNAELRLSLAPQHQNLEAMSKDVGPSTIGLDRSRPGHFPIGTLRLGPSASVINVVDARDNDNLGQSTCEAIYADNLVIEAGVTLLNPTCKVYYRTLTNDGVVSNPGNLIRVAPPQCAGDADRSGVVNFADITAILLNFNNSYIPDTGTGDADYNGVVNFADLTAVLLNFGNACQ